MHLDVLTERVREQLKLQKQKSSNTLGYVKYTGPAWGTVKEEKVDWNKNEQEIVDCVICFEKLNKVNYVQLACQHEFHETVSTILKAGLHGGRTCNLALKNVLVFNLLFI